MDEGWMKGGLKMIMGCVCIHPYQDSLYGKGKRVHNPSGKSDVNLATCTVCGNKKPIPAASKTRTKVTVE